MKGTTVQIEVKTQTGTDPFGAPVYSVEFEDVKDVLVGQPSTDEIKTSTDLFGKKLVYMIGIPKGDTHNWEDVNVIIWGRKFKTFGLPITGEWANIPLRWGQNVRVGYYE